MFSGRYNEIQGMDRGLFQTKNGNPQHFLIEGERGIGKTSLLLFMDWVAKGEITFSSNKFNFMVLNIELREGMLSDDILNATLVSLKREVAQREKLIELCKNAWNFLSKFEVAGISYNNSPDEISNEKLDELTNALIDIVNDAGDTIDGIIILIDEADRPSANAKLGEICKLITERLTRRNCEKVCLVLAGLPQVTTKIRESHESAPRVFTIMPLEALEIDERHQVIKLGLDVAEKANGFRTSIDDDAIKYLSELSEGYPHFLQEFCYCAFEIDTDNHIDLDDVLSGAFSENGAIEQLGQKYYMDMYIEQINSEDYRKVLVCMADALDGWVERQHLIDKSGVKPAIVDNALRTLKERRIIIPNPAKQGQYKLPTQSFAIWIRVKASAANKAVKDTKVGK